MEVVFFVSTPSGWPPEANVKIFSKNLSKNKYYVLHSTIIRFIFAV
jgi:hypothetical protein